MYLNWLNAVLALSISSCGIVSITLFNASSSLGNLGGLKPEWKSGFLFLSKPWLNFSLYLILL